MGMGSPGVKFILKTCESILKLLVLGFLYMRISLMRDWLSLWGELIKNLVFGEKFYCLKNIW